MAEIQTDPSEPLQIVPETTKETAHILTDRKVFLDQLYKPSELLSEMQNIHVDRELAQYLIESYDLNVFMDAPVAILDGEVIDAVTAVFYSPEDLDTYFEKFGNQILLHKVCFYPKRWSFYTLDEWSFKWVKRDKPVYQEREYWKLRFGIHPTNLR